MFKLWKPLVPDGVVSTWAPVNDVTTSLNEQGQLVQSGQMAWYFNGNYPWLSMLFCAPVIGLWYWCTDQYIVQRALGAPNETQARRGSICAAFLKLLPVFIFIIPGMICFAVYQSGKLDELADFTRVSTDSDIFLISAATGEDMQLIDAPTLRKWAGENENDPRLNLVRFGVKRPHPETGQPTSVYLDRATFDRWSSAQDPRLRYVARKNNRAFPLLVSKVLPVGVRGMVVAGLLAALMSSLAGVFNASATLFTMDFYSRLRPGVSQARLVWIGRAATIVMVLIGLAWIPVIKGSKGLYDYLQGVQAYLAPPIFVVFFLGVFWKRLNGAGCLAALVVGGIMGLFRLAVDTPVKLGMAGFENGYPSGSFLWIVNNMFFQYYSILILVVCVVVMIVVSYMTKEPDYERISGLTYGTVTERQRSESRSSWTAADVVASCAVLAAILAAYLYFRG